MDDLTTMGISGSLGFLFRHITELRNDNRRNSQENQKSHEESKDAAAKRVGGTMMRRWIYALVAFAFISVIIAGFFKYPVVLEHQLDRNFLGIIHWEKIKYVTVNGVVMLKENRQAFLSLISFYLGQGVK
ncbi:hypothetical protein MLD52_09165 [Puniceicoccaceae bacterium K14]|nr:hypothetical protein [Puniceicoccaceae bacterium K14]